MTPNNGSTPNQPARDLGKQLTKYRKLAGFALAGVPGISESKLKKLEKGLISFVKAKDVWDLCRTYNIPSEIQPRLIDLADQTGQQNLFDQLLSTQGQDWLFIEKCRQCNSIDFHDSCGIVPLLQCPEYFDSLQRSVEWPKRPYTRQEVERVRAEWKQEFLHYIAKGQITARFTIGEHALQVISDPEVSKMQRDHLLELVELPGLDIWVTPIEAGFHGSLGSEYVVMDFEDPDDTPMVWTGSVIGLRNLNRPRDTDLFRSVYEQTLSVSVTAKEFIK